MAKPPVCFIRCRDSFNNTNPVIQWGATTEVGTLLSSSVKFGTGSGSDANTKYINIASVAPVNNWQKFTIGMAIKPNWECTNGVPASSGNYGYFDWRLADSSKVFLLNPAGSGHDLAFLTGGSWTEFYMTGFDWSASDIVDFYLCVDSSGIDGTSDKIRLYINGVNEWSTTSSPPDLGTGAGSMKFLTLTSGSNFNGYIDYIKIYDYAATGANRHNERDGLSDNTVIL